MDQDVEVQPRAVKKTGPSEDHDETLVQRFLDRFSRALTAGDGRAIANMWQIPAYVLSDHDTRVIRSTTEVEQFFSGAKEQYNTRGISDTRAEITRLDWLTERIASVKVRWPYLDAKGEELGEESSVYTIRRDDDGDLKLCVTVMLGEKPAQ